MQFDDLVDDRPTEPSTGLTGDGFEKMGQFLLPNPGPGIAHRNL